MDSPSPSHRRKTIPAVRSTALKRNGQCQQQCEEEETPSRRKSPPTRSHQALQAALGVSAQDPYGDNDTPGRNTRSKRKLVVDAPVREEGGASSSAASLFSPGVRSSKRLAK